VRPLFKKLSLRHAESRLHFTPFEHILHRQNLIVGIWLNFNDFLFRITSPLDHNACPGCAPPDQQIPELKAALLKP
jgi:hypothetical protein